MLLASLLSSTSKTVAPLGSLLKAPHSLARGPRSIATVRVHESGVRAKITASAVMWMRRVLESRSRQTRVDDRRTREYARVPACRVRERVAAHAACVSKAFSRSAGYAVDDRGDTVTAPLIAPPVLPVGAPPEAGSHEWRPPGPTCNGVQRLARGAEPKHEFRMNMGVPLSRAARAQMRKKQ